MSNDIIIIKFLNHCPFVHNSYGLNSHSGSYETCHTKVQSKCTRSFIPRVHVTGSVTVQQSTYKNLTLTESVLFSLQADFTNALIFSLSSGCRYNFGEGLALLLPPDFELSGKEGSFTLRTGPSTFLFKTGLCVCGTLGCIKGPFCCIARARPGVPEGAPVGILIFGISCLGIWPPAFFF